MRLRTLPAVLLAPLLLAAFPVASGAQTFLSPRAYARACPIASGVEKAAALPCVAVSFLPSPPPGLRRLAAIDTARLAQSSASFKPAGIRQPKCSLIKGILIGAAAGALVGAAAGMLKESPGPGKTRLVLGDSVFGAGGGLIVGILLCQR